VSTRLLFVIGAATKPGRLAAAIGTAADQVRARHNDVVVAVVDLGEVLPAACDGRPEDEYDDRTRAALAEVAAADAVVLASPVYRASMTGTLKNFLDLIPVASLQAKPVGVVAMGGSQHHYLGVEGHLRDVLAWFGALVAPTAVYLTSDDFSQGTLSSTTAVDGLGDLTDTLLTLANRLAGASLGPIPLAAHVWKG
jgi:FMN reductase